LIPLAGKTDVDPVGVEAAVAKVRRGDVCGCQATRYPNFGTVPAANILLKHHSGGHTSRHGGKHHI
jgi:hypothetical protein